MYGWKESQKDTCNPLPLSCYVMQHQPNVTVILYQVVASLELSSVSEHYKYHVVMYVSHIVLWYRHAV